MKEQMHGFILGNRKDDKVKNSSSLLSAYSFFIDRYTRCLDRILRADKYWLTYIMLMASSNM